jgi:metallo-beta-lactamase class B
MRGHRVNAQRIAAGLTLGLCVATLSAQQTPTWREWNRPIPPFRIAGPLYYVGMAQVTSLLITTPQGHILIDGDFPESAATILDNVRTLGFKPEEIRILLSTHAHIDHAGGRPSSRRRPGRASTPARPTCPRWRAAASRTSPSETTWPSRPSSQTSP